jgi:hypothetical protein
MSTIKNLFQVCVSMLIMICPMFSYPSILTPGLSQSQYNFYVSKYYGVDSKEVTIPFDLPAANQFIWPDDFELDLNLLKIGQIVKLNWIAVVPRNFHIEISEVKYHSEIINDINGNSLANSILSIPLEFEVTSENDANRIRDLLEDFNMEKLKSKFSKKLAKIKEYVNAIKFQFKNMPYPSEGFNGQTNQKLERYFNAIDSLKSEIYLQVSKNVPKTSNMDKLHYLPSLVNKMYKFDSTKEIKFGNIPQRPEFKMFKKFAFLYTVEKSNAGRNEVMVTGGHSNDDRVIGGERNIALNSQANGRSSVSNLFANLHGGRKPDMSPQRVTLQDEQKHQQAIVSPVIISFKGELILGMDDDLQKLENRVNFSKNHVFENLFGSKRRILII